jgi:hypothetical protein
MQLPKENNRTLGENSPNLITLLSIHIRFFFLLFVMPQFTVLKTRVTRLGEFSPLGWLLSLGSYLKMSKVKRGTNFWATLFHETSSEHINFDKNVLGFVFGHLVTLLKASLPVYKYSEFLFRREFHFLAHENLRQNFTT